MAYTQAGLSQRNTGYGIPSGAVDPGMTSAPLFHDTSGAPSFPPMVPAQQLFNNPMVTEAAVHYGHQLASQGQAMVDQKIGRFVAMTGLKMYFAVDTQYVLKKLMLLLFPYTHQDWSPKYQSDQPIPAREDINAPDLYIPVMSFVTYVLLTGIAMGTQNRFTPEQLGVTASSLLAWLLAEVLLIWLCLYLLTVSSRLRWLDLVAYSGYKYVSMIVSVAAFLLGGVYVYYGVLAWATLAIAYFLVQSLRLAIQPHVTHGANKLRNYLVLMIALVQPLLVAWLTYGLATSQHSKTHL
ncbi:hypothetical protein EMCRGX_G032855 [Ephydatia muelleri]|eukprot:Em0019g1056a